MEIQWPLILFTFFLCLCGGILFFQGLLTFLGKGKEMQKLSLIASFVALVVGGISVFTHLEHWERIFNGFGALVAGKGAAGISGITLEMWGCVVFAIAVVLYFLFMQRSEEGVAPKWCAIFAMVIGVLLPAVTGDSYLMHALPAWDTPLLIIYYIANTAAMGALASLVIAHASKCDDARALLAKIAFFAIAAQAVITLIYAAYISFLGAGWTDIVYYFDPTLPDVAMVDEAAATSILLGSRAVLFWLGAIAVGGIVPCVLFYMLKSNEDAKKAFNFSILSLVCVVIGGIVWRVILYQVAISVFALY